MKSSLAGQGGRSWSAAVPVIAAAVAILPVPTCAAASVAVEVPDVLTKVMPSTLRKPFTPSDAAALRSMLVPAPAAYEIRYFDWVDHDRQREVCVKLYLPPPAAEMEKVIVKDEQTHTAQYYEAKRHTIQVDFGIYCHDLMKEIAKGEAPRLSSFLWHDGAWRLASHANFALPATNEPPVLDDAGRCRGAICSACAGSCSWRRRCRRCRRASAWSRRCWPGVCRPWGCWPACVRCFIPLTFPPRLTR